ncbi:Translocation protein S62 [Oleoguttula sp. CCFEE 5521]
MALPTDEQRRQQMLMQQRMQAQMQGQQQGGPPPGAMRLPLGMQPLQPGQQPTPEQIQQMQQQIAIEAQKAGLSIPQYIERIKAQAMQQQQMQQQMMQQQQMQQQQQLAQQQQGAQPGQQVPIAPGPPKPEGLAVAKFLRSQNLKLRTCIFNDERKDMFKVKRAIRALESPAYEKARKKEPLLPAVTDRVTAENTFKMLPISMLALRVSKIDPHEGHDHGKKKRVKGLWTVKIEPQQEANDDFYYVFLYQGAQWKTKLYALGALVLILALVFFPLWPYTLRLGVWWLSMGMLGLLGAFFGMAIVRLIIFIGSTFTHPPGWWLFPNLFEDVGFFDSFKPVGAWHEDEKTVKLRKRDERRKKKAKKEAKASGTAVEGTEVKEQSSAAVVSKPGATGSDVQGGGAAVQQRNLTARVEEVDDD